MFQQRVCWRWPSLSLQTRLCWAGFLFVLPALLHLIVFKFYPMVEAFRLSFYKYDLMTPPVFNGVDNYKTVWNNPLFHQSFWVSVKYMFGVSVPEWFLAFALALLLNRGMPGRPVIRLAYFFPIAMSQIVVALVWKFMYNPLGVVNTLLGAVGIGRINWLATEQSALPALILIGIWRGRLLTILTIAGIGVTLLPYFWMLSSSLKTSSEVFELPVRWLPRDPQWSNYPAALSRGAFGVYFFNSAVVALAVMAGNLLVCSLAGYGLAKFRFPYRELSFRAILSTLMLPLEIVLVPTFLVVRGLGLVNSYGGLIIPLAVDAFGIFLMRQYIKDLPDSLIEAARLDGCTERGIFWRIILPNCKPALGALALLTFRDNWDQFLWPLIVASKDTLKTFPLGLAQMEGIDSAAYHEIMAIAVIAMIPTAIIFLFFQRAFVRGIALSGLKE